jgi:hypothetical protein
VVIGGAGQAGRGIGEPAVVQAALPAGERRLVTQQRGGRRGLFQRLAQVVDHLRRRVHEPVEDPHHARVDVVDPGCASGAAGHGGHHVAEEIGSEL